MTDLEKVIKGLRCIAGDVVWCAQCPYSDVNGSGRGDRCKRECAKDTLALLKAQEPRVMTHEEVINLPEGAVAWFEEMDNGSRRYIQPMMSNGKAFMIGTHVDVNVSRGTLNWTNRRFWTSRPTDEQMEATPWEKS